LTTLEGLSSFRNTSGISVPFRTLSRIKRLITYVLRTRAPLTIASPFDLHVLGPPQTFALSQDQTLQFESARQVLPGNRSRPEGRSSGCGSLRMPLPHKRFLYRSVVRSVLLGLCFLYPVFRERPTFRDSCLSPPGRWAASSSPAPSSRQVLCRDFFSLRRPRSLALLSDRAECGAFGRAGQFLSVPSGRLKGGGV
jgi:hypothetical protein